MLKRGDCRDETAAARDENHASPTPGKEGKSTVKESFTTPIRLVRTFCSIGSLRIGLSFRVSQSGGRHRWFPLAFTLLFSVCAWSRAAERFWDGGGRSDDWTDAANWTGLGTTPVAGDSLRFPGGTLRLSNNNDFPTGTSFNALTYAGAGYTASGNEIALTGGLVISHGTGNTVINLPINVAVNQTVTVSQAGANLYLNGAVDLVGTRPILTFDGAGQTIMVGNISDGRITTGGGTIRKSGVGTLWIFQHPTYGGPTIVNGGTLRVDGRMSNSVVTVNAGGTLRGTGKVGGLKGNSGATVGPGVNSPGILESLGNVELNAGSTLNIRLNGTNGGLNYDQLKVKGTVTLGGTLAVTAGFIPAVGDRFTLIENDGADDTIGTFAGLPEGAVLTLNGRPFKISYGIRGGLGGVFGRDVNDVTLEAVPALAVWDGGGGLNKFWSQPLNWAGDTVPMPGDDMLFANTSPATLTTENDFPAGSVFGSILFGAGRHQLQGANMADLRGSIQIVESNDVVILMPLTLKGGIRRTLPGRLLLGGPLVLSASQTISTFHTNSIFWPSPSIGAAYPFITITGQVDLASHDLTIHTEPTFAFGDLFWAVRLSGSISTPGSVIKHGAGWLYNNSATVGAPFTVLEGIASGGDYSGHVLVNTGAVFNADFGTMQSLEVRAGRFITGGTMHVNGSALFQQGSVYDNAIRYFHTSQSSGDFNSDRLSSGAVELNGCTLRLSVDPASERIAAGRRFELISLPQGEAPAGTFDGLPEGARFVEDGYAFTITYANGVAVYAGLPFVWDGGGSGNLSSTAANWEADFTPIADAALVFPANVSKLGVLQDLPAGTRFRSITFGGPSYVIAGNSFRVTESIYNEIATGDNRVAADMVISGSFTCRVSNASRLLLEGSVTRGTTSATWRKTGTGTLRFAGTAPNNLSAVNVEAGEIELDKNPGMDAISANLQIGDGTNDVRVTLLADHQIADTAFVTIRNRARLDLNGNDEVIGTLQGDGTVSLNGRPGPGRTARLTVGTGSFGGAIVGDGGLTKTGSSFSSLSLSGLNTFSGMTIVDAGTLFVEGTQTNSAIRLDGGVLRGRGSVGTITGHLSGTLQPGSGGADFQVAFHSQSIALNPSTTFRALLTSVDPGYENHKLQVNGLVDLGGSVLAVDLAGSFRPTNGFSFLIIDNDGTDPVIGTFAGLPEGTVFGGAGLPFRISYVGGTGNDVVITRIAAPPSTLSSIVILSNGLVRIEGSGIDGVIYPIQAASDLNPIIQWTQAGAATGGTSGVFQFSDTITSNRPMRFYRAVSP